ncbi:hypothetical protein HK098_001885 [Nowakowskiella sp. JEL0407]|nr:hypothetical protein HK098_001885 [Nowakowskiella sp. JEL0407]
MNAWAVQVIGRNNKFYYYAPVRHNSGQMAIGVRVSNNILGLYKDVLGKPLVTNNEFDPTVFIDDDRNPNLWYMKLNQDMISYSGSRTKITLTTTGFGTPTSGNSRKPTTFEEGPWFYKCNNLYYLVYAANYCSENIQYHGPYTRGVIMVMEGAIFNNYPRLIDFGGNSHFFYNNGALQGGSRYTCSVAVKQFVYNSDGLIPMIKMLTAGAPQISTMNPYVCQEAETMAWSSGIEVEVCSKQGMDVGSIDNGDYIKIKGGAFCSRAKSFSACVASANSSGSIEIRLGSATGTLVSTCTVSGTGRWQTWTTVTCPVNGATRMQDLFLWFTGSGTSYLFNVKLVAV